jgi:hypothetical protein
VNQRRTTVPPVARDGADLAEQRLRHPVPGEEGPQLVDDLGGRVDQRAQQVQEAGLDVPAGTRTGWRPVPGQEEEVGPGRAPFPSDPA